MKEGIFMSTFKTGKLISFLCINFILTWFLFCMNVFLMPQSPIALFLWAPGISVLVLYIKDKTVFKNCTISLQKVFYLFLSIVFPIVLMFTVDILQNLLFNGQADYSASVIPLTLPILFSTIAGSIGEEIGWRGFLYPFLNSRYSVLNSSIITGLIWGLWHMGDYGEGIGFLFFVVTTIEMSIIMTWLLECSNRNLLTAILFHMTFNMCGLYLGYTPDLTTRIITVCVFCIPVFFILLFSQKFRNPKKLKRMA